MNNLLPLLVVVAVVVLVFYMQSCKLSCNDGRDNYGQDASIRANSGWVAGPMYGYDPINKFADEIEESRMHFRHKVDQAGCRAACMGQDQDTCARCLDDAGASKDGIETLVIGIMPLGHEENPKPGYKSKRREGHPPWVPPEAEFDEDYRPRSSCMACS